MRRSLLLLCLCIALPLAACTQKPRAVPETETPSAPASDNTERDTSAASYIASASSYPPASSAAASHGAVSSGTPASGSSGASSQAASLAAYNGDWQADDNDSYYGSWLVGLKIDGGSLSGTLSRDTRDAGMMADADFTGSVTNGKGHATFDDDGRGHAGTIELTFGTDAIDATVAYNKGADASGFGVRTGSIHFIRRG